MDVEAGKFTKGLLGTAFAAAAAAVIFPAIADPATVVAGISGYLGGTALIVENIDKLTPDWMEWKGY